MDAVKVFGAAALAIGAYAMAPGSTNKIATHEEMRATQAIVGESRGKVGAATMPQARVDLDFGKLSPSLQHLRKAARTILNSSDKDGSRFIGERIEDMIFSIASLEYDYGIRCEPNDSKCTRGQRGRLLADTDWVQRNFDALRQSATYPLILKLAKEGQSRDGLLKIRQVFDTMERDPQKFAYMMLLHAAVERDNENQAFLQRWNHLSNLDMPNEDRVIFQDLATIEGKMMTSKTYTEGIKPGEIDPAWENWKNLYDQRQTLIGKLRQRNMGPQSRFAYLQDARVQTVMELLYSALGVNFSNQAWDTRRAQAIGKTMSGVINTVLIDTEQQGQAR